MANPVSSTPAIPPAAGGTGTSPSAATTGVPTTGIPAAATGPPPAAGGTGTSSAAAVTGNPPTAKVNSVAPWVVRVLASKPATVTSAILAVLVVVFVNGMVLLFARNMWNSASEKVESNAINLVHDVFPSYSCVNKSREKIGYFCEQVCFECDIPKNTGSYQPIGEFNWTWVLESLYKCDGILGWNVDNSDLYSNKGLDKFVADFESFYDISGINTGESLWPTLYTLGYYGSSAKKNGHGPSNFTLQLIGETTHEFFNVLLQQDDHTPLCLNNTAPLSEFETFNCAGRPWYISAPFCAPYYCQYGVRGSKISDYQILYSASSQNITVRFFGLSGDFTFITAIYTGAITNAFAAFATLCAMGFAILVTVNSLP